MRTSLTASLFAMAIAFALPPTLRADDADRGSDENTAAPRAEADADLDADVDTRIDTDQDQPRSKIEGEADSDAGVDIKPNQGVDAQESADGQRQRGRNAAERDRKQPGEETNRKRNEVDRQVVDPQIDQRPDAADQRRDATDAVRDRARDRANRAVERSREGQNNNADRGPRGGAESDRSFGLQAQSRNGRLTVQQIDSNGAFAQSGLRADDEIVAVNGKRISTQAELNQQLRLTGNTNKATTLTVFRNGRMQSIEANSASDDYSQEFSAERPQLPSAPEAPREERFYRGAPERPLQKSSPRPSGTQKSTQKASQKAAY